MRAFVGPIQLALGCFADGKVTADRYDDRDVGVLTFNKGTLTSLRGPEKLTLSVSMRYVLQQMPEGDRRGPWKANTVGWMYQLRLNDQVLVDYHWHPISRSHENRPHLHLPGQSKVHFPTGRVLIEDVLQLAAQYGAEPRDADNWTHVDQQNRAGFALGATWGAGPAIVLPEASSRV